jgi:lysophospholipase L1-like esterase
MPCPTLLVLCLLAQAPAPAPAPAAAASPSAEPLLGDQPVSKPDQWLVRHQEFVKEAKQGGADVLFLGDSITDNWRRTGEPVWAERFAPLKAANFGISGDRTQHLLWRLENGELDGIKPKAVVVLIGTNNIGQVNSPEPPASAIVGVRAVVAEIRARLPQSRILLLAVFPRGEKPDHPMRAKVKEVNEAIAKLDDGGQHVTFLDIAGAFLEADGTLSKEIMPDSLHLSLKGYERWANAIREPLAQLLK